jgi:hypothetical protein
LNADDGSGRLTPVQKRSVWTFAGVGGAVLALLTVLQGQLSALHLFTDMKFAVSLLIGALAALITLLQSSLGNRRTEHDQARALDAALVGSATRAVEFWDPVDLGATAGLPQCDYRKRDEDTEIRSAMEQCWLVCVVGPRGSGKTRAAFEALRATRANAKILCPVDADGLRTLLQGQDQLLSAIADHDAANPRREPHSGWHPFARMRHAARRLFGHREGVPAVLWLDDLERFLDGLDIDGLTRFLGKTAGDEADEDQHPSALRLVATMRDKTHERIVGGDDDVAHRARRLLALGRVVPISALPEGEVALSATSRSPQPLPEAPRVGHLRPTVTLNGTLVVLLAIILVLVLWLVQSWAHHHGWTVPPSLADQEQAIEAALPACDSPAPPQAAAGVPNGGDWILPVRSGSCPASDSVSVFTVDDGRLNKVLTEAPKADQGIWWFRCADTSRCALPAGGRRTIIVGAFANPHSKMLPLVLYRDQHSDDVRLLAPALPPITAGVAKQRQLVLDLSPGAVASLSKSACVHPAQLCGYPADYLTAITLTGAEDSPDRVLLIAGYAVGPWYEPREVQTRAFSLEYQPSSGQVAFDLHDCRLTDNGRSAPTTVPHSPVASIPAQMRAEWEPSPSGEGKQVTCT